MTLVQTAKTVAGELPATATYSRREWFWTPMHAIPEILGFLRIDVYRGERRQQLAEVSVYEVEDLGALSGLMGHRFGLTKVWGGGWYLTAVGGLPGCTCEAGVHRVREGVRACKHLEALTALIEATGSILPATVGGTDDGKRDPAGINLRNGQGETRHVGAEESGLEGE